MGLTIHYSLKAKGSDARAQKLIQALHQQAQDLPFKEVGPVVQLSGEQCDADKRDREDPLRWLLIQATEDVEVKQSRRVGGVESGFCFTVPPTQVIAFTAWPGEGCEESNFGGLPNFLQCHLTVIALLDKAKELGCLEHVSDEGQFWKKRDIQALAQEVGSWNEMIAAFGGCLKDLAGDGVQMPISLFPDFERLEAAGQEKLPPALAQLAKLARQVAHAP